MSRKAAPGRGVRAARRTRAPSRRREQGNGERPLRLRPVTVLGGEQCATAFGVLGDADHPSALRRQYTAPSIHHMIGEQLVTLMQPGATAWAPLPAAAIHGAGCEPRGATRRGILVRNADAWSVPPMFGRESPSTQSD